jgi:hypothetical protein
MIEFCSNPTFKFSLTRSIQNITVPAGYNYMYVDMSGAASGGAGTGTAGYGARVQSYLNVVPGTLLHISVGGQGIDCPTLGLPGTGYMNSSAGYNGGGLSFGFQGDGGGSGGGGASDIRIGSLSLSDRAIVAGGGGGYYCGPAGMGLKGGDSGQFGHSGSPIINVNCVCYGHNGGGGANWTSGGSAAYSLGVPGATAGRLGVGGSGSFKNSGGGGGGFYGGETMINFF